MRWSYEERKEALKKVIARDDELNEKGGAELFQTEFVDYTEDGEFIMKIYIKPWMRNPFGNMQGGMISYFIDAVAGTLSWVEVNCDPVGTVDLNVNFIRGVEEKIDYIIVKSKVISIGRRVVVATAEVRDPEGWLMAIGTTNTTRLLPPDSNPVIVTA